MKELSMVLGLCLLFAFGLTTEIQANNDVQPVITTAKEKTITFKVYGNCGMCKRTIDLLLGIARKK